MHIQARRVFRLSSVVALSLAMAYASHMPLPFLAPLLALMISAQPEPPMGLKGLLGLLLLVLLTTGIGLLLIPLLTYYPLTAVMLVALGLYLSTYLSVNKGKALVGTFLAVGFTMISAAGTVSFALATTVIYALVFGIGIAVFCLWLVYPWFPEDPVTITGPAAEAGKPEQSNWIALRATLIVLPAYLVLLANPLAYMPIAMKAVALSQQASVMDARSAGRELLGSTFLGGFFAVVMWALLGIFPNLWMYFLWMLLFGIYFSSKIYRLIGTRFPASFWLNVVMTLFIVLGPAVEDTANGKDVYTGFFTRMGLFVAVTLYAWLAVYLLEYLRIRHLRKTATATLTTEPSTC